MNKDDWIKKNKEESHHVSILMQRIAELEKDLEGCEYFLNKTKPLSDEEIIEIFNQIWNDGGNTNGVMHRFARAIEERHGIK